MYDFKCPKCGGERFAVIVHKAVIIGRDGAELPPVATDDAEFAALSRGPIEVTSGADCQTCKHNFSIVFRDGVWVLHGQGIKIQQPS